MVNDMYEVNFDNIPADLKYDENITLWRYMNFSSLCEMLIHNFIPLININKFSDKSEGAIIKSILPKLFMGRTNRYGNPIDKGIIDYVISKYFMHTYVSSWCKTETENASMWDRYTHSNEGVAIKTNAKLLIDSIKHHYQRKKNDNITSHQQFSDEYLNSIKQGQDHPLGLFMPDIIIKEVEYVDRDPDKFNIQYNHFINGYDRLCFYYKMKDFEDESEVRISRMINFHPYIHLFHDNKELLEFHKERDNSIRGSYKDDVSYIVTKSSNHLIEQIVISPYAHKAFIATVSETMNCINLDREKAGLDKIDCDIIPSKRTNWV